MQHDPFTVFFWFILFWIGLGWKAYGQSDPNWNVEVNEYLPSSQVLVFGIVAPVFLLITLGIYIFNHFILNKLIDGESPINQFVDLATISNVSVLFIEEEAFGYYLHGRAPWSSADIPLDWLSKEITQEASVDRNHPTVSRGLPNAPGQRGGNSKEYVVQTFQCYVPKTLREDLKAIHNSFPSKDRLTDEAYYRMTGANKEYDNEDLVNKEESAKPDAKMAPREYEIRSDEFKALSIQERLKEVLSDKIESQDIHEGDWWARLMQTYPDRAKTGILNDRFTVMGDQDEWAPTLLKLTYSSLEVSRIQIYSMAFVLFERMLGGNSMVAILILAIVEYLLKMIRHERAQANLSAKSYIDECFLC